LKLKNLALTNSRSLGSKKQMTTGSISILNLGGWINKMVLLGLKKALQLNGIYGIMNGALKLMHTMTKKLQTIEI
jgi:hypothetical protein